MDVYPTISNARVFRDNRLSITTRLVQTYLRTRWRGGGRLVRALAGRTPALQSVPVRCEGFQPVYVDLRDRNSVALVRGSPHAEVPQDGPLVRVLRHVTRPGDTALDVGANRGFISVALATMVGPDGHVVVFEPNPNMASNLERSLAGFADARLLRYALCDTNDAGTLFVPEMSEVASLSAEYASLDAGPPRPTSCMLRRLDDLIAAGEARRPDVMKVDVEGAELLVFRGARRTLDREDAPTLAYEANLFAAPLASGHPSPAATEYLASLPRPRYRFFFVWNWGVLTRLQPGQYVQDNILAIPEARLDRWPELRDADVLRF